MNNKKILDSLNEYSKKYMDDFISYFTYLKDFKKHQENITEYDNNPSLEMDFLKGDTFIDEDSIAAIAAFTAALENDQTISRFFYKYGITTDNFKNLYSDLKINDAVMDEASNSKYFKDFNLRMLFLRVSLKVAYTCYLEKEKIPYDKLTTFQIFDAIIEDLAPILETILKNNYPATKDEDIFESFNQYIHDYYNDFATLYYGVNIDEEAEKEINSFKAYEFDECIIEINGDENYITFKENANLDKLIWHIYNNSKNSDSDKKTYNKIKEDFINSIKLPMCFGIEFIDTKNELNENIIKELLFSDTKPSRIPIGLRNLTNNTLTTIWLDKYYAFTPENQQIIDSIMKDDNDNNYKEGYKMNEDVKLYTPALDKYGIDLTNVEYFKDPSVGREKDIRRIEQILCYPEKDKSIIITGIAGSGKTALAKGLAYRIQQGNVPKALKNLRIISIDSATLVAGTKYVGTLEEKMKTILEEASQSKNIIIFMDEIHQALGAGVSEGDSNSVAEILKPYLDYGLVRVIGATTTDEYNEFVSRDDAFKTRFKRINIDEPDNHIVYQILDDLIESYNRLNEKDNTLCPRLNLNTEERDMVIKWLIDSTKAKFRSYNDRASNPRLVLDIIKEAYAIAAINDKDEVTMSDLKEALLLEERLYLSSRQSQVKKLDEIKPSYNTDNVIPFELVLKK